MKAALGGHAARSTRFAISWISIASDTPGFSGAYGGLDPNWLATPQNKKGAMITHDAFIAATKFVVGRAGFEPATNGLKVRCSTS